MGMESTAKNKRVFLPLTIDRNLWDIEATMVFLNQVYCEQLDEVERSSLYHSTCKAPLPVKNKDFQKNIRKIAVCIGGVVNSHCNICEDRGYWEKLFFRWLLYIVYDIQVKLLQFEELKKNYPDQMFYTHTKKEFADKVFFEGGIESLWEDDYHLWLYTYLAKNYFGVQVIPVEVGEQVAVPAAEKKERNNSFLQTICRRIKKVFTESPRCTLRKAICYYHRIFDYDNAEVLYYWLNASGDTYIHWGVETSGKIQQLRYPSNRINVPMSSELRGELTSALSSLDTVSPIMADVIGRTFPKLYLEEYSYHHDNSVSLLKKYRRLKVVFSLTGILTSCPETIFSLLAQNRGVKIIGLQHGGNHEFIEGVLDQEEYLNDVFYSWAGEKARPCSAICEILSAPSYKFECYRNIQCADQYILYVGTSLRMSPMSDEYAGADIYRIRYIERQIKFFSLLDRTVREDLCVKEFYVDSGWHITSKIARLFPMLHLLGAGRLAKNFGAVDIDDRNMSFAESLAYCKLMICDHFSTTWREALYLNKPFIMLLDRETYRYREEALESVHLMESVGIILYDCEEAASLLNRIHDDISGWWNEPERQAIIQKIRKNYLFEVENIDEWWMRELLRQASR